MTDHRLSQELIAIRHALLIGLESFGEVQRVLDAHEIFTKLGKDPHEMLKPTHPTGTSDTIGIFAAALRDIESMEYELRSEASAKDDGR